MTNQKKMELTLEGHSTWYGEEIKKAFNNGVWMFLEDNRYNKTDLEQIVNNSLRTGYSFDIELTFKTGAGKSQTRLIMQEYQG